MKFSLSREGILCEKMEKNIFLLERIEVFEKLVYRFHVSSSHNAVHTIQYAVYHVSRKNKRHVAKYFRFFLYYTKHSRINETTRCFHTCFLVTLNEHRFHHNSTTVSFYTDEN